MRGNEFADLQAFVAIAEHGNFARAAKHLGVSPSALSQVIRQLEARLGVRVLNRTTRSVSLTEAGEQLLARVKPALGELEAAVGGVRALRGKPSGTVRVNIPRIAALAHLEPLFGRFHEAYPDIVLDVTLDDAVRDIVAAGYDVGVRLGELLEKDMVAVRLGGSLRQVVFASPAYLERHGAPATPMDLHQHRCINWRQPGSGSLYSWDFQKPDGEWFAVAVKGPLIVSDRELALQAAVDGVGIGFWEESRVRPWIKAGKLVALLEDWSGTFPGWHIYYPKQRHTPATVRAFVDFMRQAWG